MTVASARARANDEGRLQREFSTTGSRRLAEAWHEVGRLLPPGWTVIELCRMGKDRRRWYASAGPSSEEAVEEWVESEALTAHQCLRNLAGHLMRRRWEQRLTRATLDVASGGSSPVPGGSHSRPR